MNKLVVPAANAYMNSPPKLSGRKLKIKTTGKNVDSEAASLNGSAYREPCSAARIKESPKKQGKLLNVKRLTEQLQSTIN